MGDDVPFRKFSPATQCEGKRKYSTKDDAKSAARRSERSLGRMKPYRCPHCDAWHLGHAPKITRAQRAS